ncbi:hypothetical protein ACIBCM_24680 [Streptomyces sp. NPDC051018]
MIVLMFRYAFPTECPAVAGAPKAAAFLAARAAAAAAAFGGAPVDGARS